MRQLRTLLLAAVAISAIVVAAPAYADDAWGDGVQVMNDSEMADLRGGLALPDGTQIDFGAVVTTYVDGQPALQTTLTWTDAGAIVSDAIGSLGQRLDSLTPEQRAAMGLNGLTGEGVVINDAAGVTALVHNVTAGSLQNLIVNNATGRDLSQTVDVTIGLPGFESLQQALETERMGLRLSADLQAMLASRGP